MSQRDVVRLQEQWDESIAIQVHSHVKHISETLAVASRLYDGSYS